MPQHSKNNILAGRKAVDAYRADHAKLHKKLWYRGIPEEHTPLLNKLLVELKGLGFNSVEEFFNASEALLERVSECNRCGKCCEDGDCKNYRGEGICAIYEDRPQECRVYPAVSDFLSGKIPQECSLSFQAKQGTMTAEELRWR